MAALSVQPRPTGSSLILRFLGTIVPGAALATYPKATGQWSAGPVGLSNVHVLRVLMGDPLDPSTLLPPTAFDNTAPAGSPPQPTASGIPASLANILNGTDLDVSEQVWAQNAHITVEPTDLASVALLVPFAAQPRFCIDAPNSGLGGTTGLPVLCMALDLGAQPPGGLEVLITVEIRHSEAR